MTEWAQRLAEFTARKEHEARVAVPHPLTTEIDRATGDLKRIGNAWSERFFGGSFCVSPPRSADLPSTSLVFVRSREGNTGAADPETLGGGATDKHLIYEGLSRVAADAVLAGAETVRSGDLVFSVWHTEMVSLRSALGYPRHPIQIVATLGGLALDRALLFNVPALRVILLTVCEAEERMREALAARRWITTLAMNQPADLPHACRTLRQWGVERVSAVGGRTMATALLDAGLVQDLYLTTSPRSAGEPNTPFYPRPLRTDLVTRKHGSGPEAGVVFEHLRVGTT